MFYSLGPDSAAGVGAGSLRVLRHDKANPAARAALRTALVAQGYVSVDKVCVVTLVEAAAARAAAATAAQQAAADAAAAARMSADIRAALIRGAQGAHSRGAPVVPRHAQDPPQAAQGIDVAQLAPQLLGAPSKLPPFALCDLVQDMEQGGKDVDVAYGPLVGCIEDGKRLKPVY